MESHAVPSRRDGETPIRRQRVRCRQRISANQTACVPQPGVNPGPLAIAAV
jgi:hypothetical protein